MTSPAPARSRYDEVTTLFEWTADQLGLEEEVRLHFASRIENSTSRCPCAWTTARYGCFRGIGYSIAGRVVHTKEESASIQRPT